MGLRALPLQHNSGFISTTKVPISRTSHRLSRNLRWVVVSAKQEKDEEKKREDETSLFTRLTDALDFAQVRSEKDAELLYEAREATKSGGKMSKEQVGLLYKPRHFQTFWCNNNYYSWNKSKILLDTTKITFFLLIKPCNLELLSMYDEKSTYGSYWITIELYLIYIKS